MNSMMYLYSVFLLPIWIIQAVWLKKTATRLPEASGKRDKKYLENTKQKTLVVMGDSVAAGVGVNTIEESVAGQLVKQLSLKLNEPISWSVFAKSGDTLENLLNKLSDIQPSQWDMVVVSIGVNDVTSFTSCKRWQVQLKKLVSYLAEANPNCKIILLPIPDLGEFPLLAKPLSRIFSWRSDKLNQASAALEAQYPQLTLLTLTLELGNKHFADDGFHPSKYSCQLIAKSVVDSFYR